MSEDLLLPSASSAMAFVNGQSGALPTLLVHMGARAGIIGIGLWLAGSKNIFKNSLVASATIETFVLIWAMKNQKQSIV